VSPYDFLKTRGGRNWTGQPAIIVADAHAAIADFFAWPA
jgi:hypothetical protein